MTSSSPRRLRAACIAAVSALALGSASSVMGQTTYAFGSGGGGWSLNGNWDSGEPVAGVPAVLPSPIPALASPIPLDAAEAAHSLTINDSWTLNGGDLSLDTGEIIVAPGMTATINSTLAGAAGLLKSGTGTLVLGGANTYTGTTAINAGTLRIGVNNTLPTGEAVAIGTPGSTLGGPGGTAGSLDLSNASQTIAGLTFLSSDNTLTNTVTIGAGQKLTINGTGGMTLGFTGTNVDNVQTNVTFSGGGELEINNAAAIVDVARPTNPNNNTPASHAVLDVSALSLFKAVVADFRLGFGSEAGGTLTLSNTANEIEATNLHVAHSNGQNGENSLLVLGAGTNAIRANTVTIGRSKVNGTIRFASQTSGSPGTVTFNNKAGTGRATFLIGSNEGTGTASNLTGTLDLRGHDSTVSAGTVTLGKRNDTNSGSGTGIIHFDTGTFDVNTLDMGVKSNTGSGTATGTLNVSGGTFIVNTNFRMATRSGSGGEGFATVNLTGGTLDTQADIVRVGGGSADETNSIATVNVNGGTLEMHGGVFSGGVIVNLQSGTLRNLAEANGGSPLTKSTAGLLVLEGTNAYSSPMTIAEGTLRVAGAAAFGGQFTSSVTVEDSGLLDLKAAAISDLSTLILTSTDSTAEVNLDFAGTDIIGGLTLNGVPFGPGTYGSIASGAANPGLGNPNDFFAGGGTLTIVPEPGAACVIGVVLAGLCARRRRGRE